MAIDKLPEFAKDGQKNTDDLVLTDGFPVLKKPARQWFNWLFNTVSLKINEIIDNKIDFENIVNNLTTDDATKPVSAQQAKKLQDEKIAIGDLINNLTTGGSDKPITAEAVKYFFEMFNNRLTLNGYQKLPKGLILQWGTITHNNTSVVSVTFPISFPNGPLSVVSNVNENLDIYAIGQAIGSTKNGFMSAVYAGPAGTPPSLILGTGLTVYSNYIAIGY